jgi:methylmalonyl-CoA/ethylmalonyl-CoA epimerase
MAGGDEKIMAFRLDHIGLVVKSLSESVELFHLLGFHEITQPEPDPIQKVSACFIKLRNGQGVYIELLEPTEESSPVTIFLKRGGGLHHLCFEVDDIEALSNALREKEFRIVSPLVDCVGYDRSFGRKCTEASRIAFFLLPNKTLIELIQKGALKED